MEVRGQVSVLGSVCIPCTCWVCGRSGLDAVHVGRNVYIILVVNKRELTTWRRAWMDGWIIFKCILSRVFSLELDVTR
jgi:hypothetical protein